MKPRWPTLVLLISVYSHTKFEQGLSQKQVVSRGNTNRSEKTTTTHSTFITLIDWIDYNLQAHPIPCIGLHAFIYNLYIISNALPYLLLFCYYWISLMLSPELSVFAAFDFNGDNYNFG